jgi:hypothetical protein
MTAKKECVLMRHWLNTNRELNVYKKIYGFLNNFIPNPGFKEGMSFPFLSL